MMVNGLVEHQGLAENAQNPRRTVWTAHSLYFEFKAKTVQGHQDWGPSPSLSNGIQRQNF